MRLASALAISGATMASRVLGLVRDQLFAALIGANRFSDAFVVAFRIPNLLRDLFAEGALSSAFVPTFAKVEHDRGREAAYRLSGTLIGLILIVVGLLSLLGALFAAPIVAFLAPGFQQDQIELAAGLVRIMMPFLLLVSLSAVAMGMLNAQQRFTAPALAPAAFNVGSIVAGVSIYLLGYEPRLAVVGWSIGALLGGVLQLLVQVPALWRLGFRFKVSLSRMSLRDPGIRRIGGLMAAAWVGLSATEINILVNTIFASKVESATTWLQMAFRLMQLPLGVFGVAIATVAGVGVARLVAAGNMAKVQETLGAALRLVAFFTLPSMALLMTLAAPIISLIYEHGRFGAGDTAGTAAALVCYALGLYSYAAVKVLAPAFYAVGAARVAVVGSILGMLANVLLNVTLFPVLSYRGVAIGTSLAATVNLTWLLLVWRRRFGGFAMARLYRQGSSVLLAAVATGGAAYLVWRGLDASIGVIGLWRQLLLALVPLTVGGVVYLAMARVLRIEELEQIRRSLTRRRAAVKPPASP